MSRASFSRAAYDKQQPSPEQLRDNWQDRQLLVRPNGELAAARGAKVETVATGKFENVLGDVGAKIDNFCAHLFQVRVIENDERTAALYIRGFFRREEPAGHPAIIEGGIIGTVILKDPAEERGKEIFCGREISRGHLDVINCVGQ